jgi:large subunit ribosomal protein L21
MYAVIDAGGKQERVEVGQRVDVELLRLAPGDELTLEAILVVDGEHVAATPDALAGSSVSARVVGEALGPKIDGFTYKPKSRSRRRFGHRQHYTTLEITSIDPGGNRPAASKPAAVVEATEAIEAEPVAEADDTAGDTAAD